MKQHKPWFDKECSKLLDQNKQVKLYWLENPNQTKGYNRNNVWWETSRTFRNKKSKYL